MHAPRRFRLLVASAALAATAFAGSFATPAWAQDVQLPPGVVARVHGEDVTEAQLLDRLARRYETNDKGREVLNQIVDDLCVAEEAKRRNVSVSDEELAAYVQKLAKVVHEQSGGHKTIDDVLKETSTTRAEFDRTAREFILRQKMAVTDLGGNPGEDLPEHRVNLWVSSIKRKSGVKFNNLPDGVLAQIGESLVVDRARFAKELVTRLPKEIVAGVRTELVLDAATRHAVEKSGVVVTDADVNAQVTRLRERFDKNPNVQAAGVSFEAFLRQTFGFGEAELRKDATFRARVGLERMVGKDITDEQIRKSWEDNRKAYGERALLRQVFIPAGENTSQFQGKGRMLTFREANEIALRAKIAILEKAGQLPGASAEAKKVPLPDVVTAIAKDFVMEAEDRQKAGEPVAWTRAQVEGHEDLEKAVFSGEMGTLIGPIRSGNGYHVLVVEQLRPAPKFEECRETVRDDLIRVAVRRFQVSLRVDPEIVYAKE